MNAQYGKRVTAWGIAYLAPVVALALAGCQVDGVGSPTEAVAAGPLAAQLTAEVDQFTDWSAPVNLGPAVNSTVAENNPAVAKDGLSLYFARGGPFDMLVSRRNGLGEPWMTAQSLGSLVNSPAADQAPTLSPDGHRLFFNSTRPGGSGGHDLYVARRRDKRDDFGWGVPVNLGNAVNTSADEVQAALFEDDVTGILTLYFTSNRPGGVGGNDIYASQLLPDETFGPPVLIAELSSPLADASADTEGRPGNADRVRSCRDARHDGPLGRRAKQHVGSVVDAGEPGAGHQHHVQ